MVANAAALAGILMVTAGTGCAEEGMTGQDIRSTDLPRARDGDVAVQQELDAARKARTVAAYDLFLERHPRHPLAETARRERQALIEASPD